MDFNTLEHPLLENGSNRFCQHLNAECEYAEQITALAPTEPSAQDRQVAAEATSLAAKARTKLTQQRLQESSQSTPESQLERDDSEQDTRAREPVNLAGSLLSLFAWYTVRSIDTNLHRTLRRGHDTRPRCGRAKYPPDTQRPAPLSRHHCQSAPAHS